MARHIFESEKARYHEEASREGCVDVNNAERAKNEGSSL